MVIFSKKRKSLNTSKAQEKQADEAQLDSEPAHIVADLDWKAPYVGRAVLQPKAHSDPDAGLRKNGEQCTRSIGTSMLTLVHDPYSLAQVIQA
jgi:hypothetical protein